MTGIVREGYLMKYINLFKGWKKRYCILVGHELIYKDKMEDMKAKRIIDIYSSEIEMSTKDDTAFQIKFGKKHITLKAPNVFEKVKWVDSLRLSKGATIDRIAFDPSVKTDEKIKQELLEAIQTMYIKEHDSITKAMGKIWANHFQIEDVLSTLIPVLQQLNTPQVTDLSDKLETLFNSLKTSIQEGMTAVENYNKCLNNSVKTEEDKEESKEFVEEFFDAIEKEEIKSDNNRNEDTIQPLRKVLPAQRCTIKNFGIWEVLKGLIGKDLSHFSIPVYFNEPLSMLQKIAEGMEYEKLLFLAGKEKDSLKRLIYVSSYTIAYYYNTLNRIKKPFNPILGETFEFVDKNFRFFSEQVCHHPPISALFAESSAYEFWMHSHVKLKFWGKSIEATPLGSMYVLLKATGELFTINRPISGAYNLIIGKSYVDNFGECICTNHKTGEKANITFHRKGWKEATYSNVTGKVFDAKGLEVYSLNGKWTENIIATGRNETFQVWSGNPRPSEWEKYYSYSNFTMQLNYLPDCLLKVLPRSDTRFRPDQRALENGNLKLASNEKLRLEDKQRQARKKMESQKLPYTSLYFTPTFHEITHETYYKFNGEYWKDREKQDWSKIPDLF